MLVQIDGSDPGPGPDLRCWRIDGRMEREVGRSCHVGSESWPDQEGADYTAAVLKPQAFCFSTFSSENTKFLLLLKALEANAASTLREQHSKARELECCLTAQTPYVQLMVICVCQ